MKRSLYSLLFAALLGAVCAGLLTAARELTAARREANAQAERIRHVLDALGDPGAVPLHVVKQGPRPEDEIGKESEDGQVGGQDGGGHARRGGGSPSERLVVQEGGPERHGFPRVAQ